MRLLRSLFILFAGLFTVPAFAQSGGNWYLSPGVFYQSDQLKQNSNLEEQNLNLDLRLGYQIMHQWYLGFVYAIENVDTKASGYANATDNYSKRTERQSFGPTFGYFFGQPFVLLSLYLQSSWKWATSSSSGTRNLTYEGWGWHLHLGYRFPLGGFQIGPELIYKNWIYNKKSEGGSSEGLSTTLKETRIDPMISAWFDF